MLADLTSDEAKLLVRFSDINRPNPFVSVASQVKTDNQISGEIVIIKHFSKLAIEAKCQYPKNIEQYIDNLVRLNLVEIPELIHYSNKKIYEELESDPTLLTIKTNLEKKLNTQITFTRKMVRITSLGFGLCKACKIDQLPSWIGTKA